MSYQVSGSSGGPRGGGGGGAAGGGGRVADSDTEYIRLDAAIREALDRMVHNIASISMDIPQLGTARDSKQVRDRLAAATEETKTLARETGQNIKRLGALEASTENEKQSRRLQQQKLKREFETALDSFRAAERQKMAKEESLIKIARTESISKKANPHRLSQMPVDGGAGMADELASQQQSLIAADPERLQRLNAEIDFNDAIIAEREADIVVIEQTIMEVNSIFTDLANIVTEQGEMLNQMDQNIESAVSNTGGAAKQLRIANDYHQSARNKQVCCLIIVVVIVGVVIAAISLGLKK